MMVFVYLDSQWPWHISLLKLCLFTLVGRLLVWENISNLFVWPEKEKVKLLKDLSNYLVAEDLKQFIISISSIGFTEFHIIVHSMGARILHSYVTFNDTIHFSFAKYKQSNEGTITPIGSLKTIIFINPDLELEKIESLYQNLTDYCHHMTIYTDVRDRPLLLSQFLHHKKSLGRFTKSFKEFKYLDMVDCSKFIR